MLEIKKILNNPEVLKKALLNRGWEKERAESTIKNIVDLGDKRSYFITQKQEKENQLNKTSKIIGESKRKGEDTSSLMKEVSDLKKDMFFSVLSANNAKQELEDLLIKIPNIPLDTTPIGSSEKDNVVLKEFSNLERKIISNVVPHYDIGKELDILDFERAVKMSGSRFVIFKKNGARLVRALLSFMLDTHVENGYIELNVPTIVKTNMLYGTGQLPKFAEDLYKIENEDKWMISTAEIPITNYYNDEIIDLTETKKFVGYTKCYRSEAGSGGKDTKGLIRSHEFHKVELVKIVSEEKALEEYFKTVNDAKSILEALKIPYQEVELCTGDLGFSSQKTIDLELWLPSENKYREVSSISLFGDFQGRRAKIRYRDENNKTKYAYTINGSGLAIDRVIAALLEIYQNEDGSIEVPKVLIPYMNGIKKITK